MFNKQRITVICGNNIKVFMANKRNQPRYAISGSLDLHGCMVNDGFLRTKEFLDDCKWAKKKFVSIVTGQSGQMCKEFPDWMNTLGYTIVQTGMGNFIVKTF